MNIKRAAAILMSAAVLLGLCACAGTVKDAKEDLDNDAITGEEEFLDENQPTPDPLEGKEISEYTTLELAECIASGMTDMSLDTYLLQKLYSEPVDTFDTITYAAAEKIDYFFDCIVGLMTMDDMTKLESALMEIYDFYDENKCSDVISGGEEEQRRTVWSSSIDMRSDAELFGEYMVKLADTYAESEIFLYSAHLLVYKPGTNYPVYISVDSSTAAAAVETIDGQELPDGTKTGMYILPIGSLKSNVYEIYVCDDGTVTAVDNTTAFFGTSGQAACSELFSRVQSALGMQFTVVSAIKNVKSAAVVYEDAQVNEITDTQQISDLIGIINAGQQMNAPKREEFGPSIVCTIDGAEEIVLRTLINEPSYVVTNYNICYDCGENVFDLIGMADLLEEFEQ